jgi:hypothetical protein
MELKRNVPPGNQDRSFYIDVSIYHLASMWVENDEFISNAINATRKFFSSINALGDYENLLLTFFQKASTEQNAENTRSMLSELKANLTPLLNQPVMWQHSVGFPVLEWITAKLESRRLQDVLRR